MDDRNLYAPLAAAVTDPVEPRTQRPKEVTWAIVLIWIWLATNASLYLPLAIEVFNESLNVFGILALVAIPIGTPVVAVAWITNRIGAGRRWARILTSVCFGVGLISLAGEWRDFLQDIHAGELQAAFVRSLLWTTRLIKLLLSVATVVLLFTRRANLWFKTQA